MALLRHAERLAGVHPRLAAFANLAAAQSSVDLCAVTGLRSPVECEAKWAEGRTAPGPHAGQIGYPALGLTVTNCKDASQTAHSLRATPEGDYGCAIDLQFVGTAGALLDLDTPAHCALYESLALLAQEDGLVAGLYFRKVDASHVELASFRDYPLVDSSTDGFA